MTTLRGVMDTVAAPDYDGLTDTTLYGDLAPVYEFERKRMRDYEAIIDYIASHAPSDATAIAVGACGPGFILADVASRFEEAVGIDLNPRMLDLAAGRTDAHLIAADLRSFVASERFNVFTLLGGSIAHLPAKQPDVSGAGHDGSQDAVHAVLANAHASLAPGGVFVCDFMERGTLRSGTVSEDTFESEQFRIERTIVTTGTELGTDSLGATGRYTIAYDVTDKAVGETVRVGTTTTVREFGVPELLGAALSAGFDGVTLSNPPTHGRALVARRSE